MMLRRTSSTSVKSRRMTYTLARVFTLIGMGFTTETVHPMRIDGSIPCPDLPV